jgi:hypothetical protein
LRRCTEQDFINIDSAGSLIANATMRAKASAGTAIWQQN